MDTFWILAGAMIAALMALAVRFMVMRRSYQRSGMEFRRNTAGKSYFDRNKSCHAYTQLLLHKLAPGRALASLRVPSEGGEALIGLVLAHPTGVYVFEIKDYGGALNGDADSEYWTLGFQNGRTEKLYNPLWQGQAHIRVLEELLGIPEELFYQYVVFGQRCQLREVPETNGNMALVEQANLRSVLEKDLAERAEALTAEQTDAILDTLKNYSLQK